MEKINFGNKIQKEYYDSKKEEAITLDGGIIKRFFKKDKTDPIDLIRQEAEKENKERDEEMLDPGSTKWNKKESLKGFKPIRACLIDSTKKIDEQTKKND